MKILQIAPYVTIDSKPNLTGNKTGFGYMVYDIAAGLAKENEEDMFLLNCQYEEFTKEGIRFIENNKLKTLPGLSRICSMIKLIGMICKYPMPLISLVKFVYQWTLMGYLDKIIRVGNYDVVHIHGCGYINMFIIDLCEKHKVKFVVTFHGLNSFDDSVSLELAGKRFEKDFLRKAHQRPWQLTFISIGMKKRVMDFLQTDKADNIHIVCNSFHFNEIKSEEINIRAKYNIPAEAKIILYVGNQSYNKNQKQMVRAFSRLAQRRQENTYVLFLGGINKEYNLQEEINKQQSSAHLIVCGTIPKEQVVSYYKQSDATALFTNAEGFGLSLTEGMSYGLPAIAIKTIDTFEDLYSKASMIGVDRYDDQLIADGLEELLVSKWNKDDIIKYSAKFASSEMPDEYAKIVIINSLRHVAGISDSLSGNCKLLCCVGNIGKRKNQKQIISAFNWLPDELKRITYILFIGGEEDSYHFEDAVNKSAWSKHFIRCGVISKSNVADFYKACDGVILVSLSEGFGLSLIEGMFYGKPCLAINNMDAFEDIYSPDAVVGVAKHDDKLIGKGIEELLTKQWDESLIKKHAEKFTNQNMTKNYMDVMKLCIRI